MYSQLQTSFRPTVHFVLFAAAPTAPRAAPFSVAATSNMWLRALQMWPV